MYISKEEKSIIRHGIITSEFMDSVSYPKLFSFYISKTNRYTERIGLKF